MLTSDSRRSARDRLLRLRLPPAYRAFIQGERVAPASRCLPDTPLGLVSVRSIYSPEEVLHARRVFHGRLPIAWLPVGYDDCGNQLCISLKSADRGSVYFWDHESECTSWKRRSPGVHSLIAASFQALLDNLEPLPPVNADSVRIISAWIDPTFLSALGAKGHS